jgi:hypothetical protein
MIDFVKKAFDISFNDVADSFLLNRPPQSIQTCVLIATSTVAIAAVLEYGFVDGFQHPLDHQLHYFVFKTAYT